MNSEFSKIPVKQPDTDRALPTKSSVKPEALPSQEYGGRQGLEPTRYGDWEKSGRCIDF